MKRRDFGLLAGTSLATAAVVRPAQAQSATPDPNLLNTTLTPLGGERAGNADGSIPAWTGGLTAPPLPPTTPTATHIFEDEQPLYEVNAGNMAQYADLLTEGTKAQITKFGLTLNVFKTHRTAAAPQYVYDNTAKNAVNAKLDPRGGRLGFTGAYGGVPFPIIDTANPLNGGAQIIWNHLTAWFDYSDYSTFSHGYYSKGHYYKAPGSVVGQEQLVWHSTNVNINPDIVWTLLNGQGRVRKAPNEQYDTPNPSANGLGNLDESSTFYGNPSQYDWTVVGKQEFLVPYNCNKQVLSNMSDMCGPHFIKPEYMRWEKHRLWIVDATLHPGIHNVRAKRRLYFDEDTWYALLGEGYDADNVMSHGYMITNFCVPSIPGTIEGQTMCFQLTSGDWFINGNASYAQHKNSKYETIPDPSTFEPQEMAAKASF